MKTTIKPTLHVWLTGMTSPSGEPHITATTIDGMESHGWVFIKTIQPEIEINDIDINSLKESALKEQLEKIKEKHEIEVITIEDNLRKLKEL